MMRAHRIAHGQAETIEVTAETAALPEGCAWLDLWEPTQAEERTAERWLGLNLPTREEMREIEASSRLYEEGGAAFMTATVVSSSESAQPEGAAVTFVLNEHVLVTIRYADPQAFRTFQQTVLRQPALLAGSSEATTALLDAIVDRLADILERVQGDLDVVSRIVFDERSSVRGRAFNRTLARIGRNGDLVGRVRESLVSIGRVDGFARRLDLVRRNPAAASRLKTLGEDIQSLTDHASFLSGKVEFLLDATLGKINIEQTATLKIFSVVAVVFMPPTLIASVYGMNFEHMPELDWPFGYPAALAAMAVAAVTPYWLFRRLGWL